MSNVRFPKKVRLLRPAEFDRVFKYRASAASGQLVLYAAPNELGHVRLGLTVSRKVGGAVVRNRWKRVLREAFRKSQHNLPALDVVFLPRGKGPPDSRRLMNELMELVAAVEKRIAKKATKKS